MNKEKVLVIGASENEARFSNKAIKLLKSKGYDVFAVGRKDGLVDGVVIHGKPIPLAGVDTISLYLRPENQKEYSNYIDSVHPKRVIFNPGAEHPEFANQLNAKGIKTEDACTLVLLNIGAF
ncbi:CoA-binding protein [Flavobacteriales bacterium]|nr:CoA-binding protein [Flavobacteriales bacterium]MDC3338165.1 CoA-binding protein [Flavobacteriales bacterium]